jgi:hypothetical protein
MDTPSFITRQSIARNLGFSVKTLQRRILATGDSEFIRFVQSRRLFSSIEEKYICTKLAQPGLEIGVTNISKIEPMAGGGAIPKMNRSRYQPVQI